MQYFQQVVRLASGSRAQVGAFRRPYPDNYRADEVYSLLSHRWEWTPDLDFILTGRQDGDVVEVTEEVIREFLAAKAPDDDIDSILAALPLPRTGRGWRSVESTFPRVLASRTPNPSRSSARKSSKVGSSKYYVVIHKGFTREWPSGLRRRTVIDESGGTTDEAWTANRKWEPSTFFSGPFFGDFSNEDVPRFEVNEEEADRVREMLGARPRGGPFTEAGQKWLTEHPNDPAAKYLGVSGPEYDAAGRLVKPMGALPGS